MDATNCKWHQEARAFRELRYFGASRLDRVLSDDELNRRLASAVHRLKSVLLLPGFWVEVVDESHSWF